MALWAFASEVVFGGYVRSAYGTSISPPSGYAFLTPYLLVFGAYLISKGAPKPIQIPLLALVAVLAAGNSAHLVMTGRMDAAAVASSLIVSSFMLAISYTLLVVGKDSQA